MYLIYYGLKEKPFSISTDPKFLWLGEKHKEAFSVLKYGVLDNKGFLLLTGDVGAGKTTLIHALTLSLGNDVVLATVPDPGLELMDFCRYIAHEFKLDMAFNTKTEFIIIFREFLHDAHKNGKKVLLIVDEAQRLSNELLEEIRMLSNIELNEVKLLNIFFVGQLEFNNILIEDRNRAVKQRITVSYHIKPLSEKETGMYIRHRLKVAGANKNIFSFVAINHIYQYAKGCPRLINIICDLAMLIGYSKDIQRIGVDIVNESIESFEVKPHLVEEEDLFVKKIKKDQSGGKVNKLLLYCFVLLIVASLFFFSYNKRNVLVNFIAGFIPAGELQDEIVDKPDHSEKILAPAYIVQQNKEKSIESETEKIKNDLPEPGRNEDIEEAKVPPFEFEKTIIDFHHNSNEVLEDAYKKLDDLADFMKQKSEVCVFITGYTDELGSYAYNVNLSTFRANIVKSYLIGKGVDQLRIKATGLGPTNPKASNATAVGRKVNRRVEIEAFNYYKKQAKN